MKVVPFKAKHVSTSPILKLDKMMLRNKTSMPSYDFTEQENNQWQVTCSIPCLNIKETVSGGARHEVRELVAEKVLGVITDKGVLDG